MRRPSRILAIAVSVLAVLAIAAFFALLKSYRMPSAAMEPTLRCATPEPGCSADTSDRFLVVRFALGLEPGRGDLVAFESPPESAEVCGTSGTFVKRVIGLPGEDVRGRGGVLVVDGNELREDYLGDEHLGEPDFDPVETPADHYFLLGDNRRLSCDSRHYGAVPRENFVGRVVFVYWPPSRIGVP